MSSNSLIGGNLIPPALSGTLNGALVGQANAVGVNPFGTATISGSPILGSILNGNSAQNAASSAFGLSGAGVDASALGLSSFASSLGTLPSATNSLAGSLQSSTSLDLASLGSSLGGISSLSGFSPTSMAAPSIALDTSNSLGGQIPSTGSASEVFLGNPEATMASIQQQNAMIQDAIGATSQQIIQAQMQQAMLAIQLQSLVQQATQAISAAPAATGVTTAAATPVNQTQLSAQLDELIVGGTAQERAELKQSLLAISQDPDGQKLLTEAVRNGTTFAAGNPGAVAGEDDPGVVVNGVTETVNGHSAITVADAGNIKTLVHEMVHATTTGDDNSQDEEGIANVIGRRVEARLNGTVAPNAQQVFNATFNGGVYANLAASNNIRNSLAQLGINAGIAA